MAIPSVNINVLDGGLGIQSPSNGDVLCFIGCSDSGTLNAPAFYTRIKDLQTAFGAGPLVEAAAYAIETVGKPVLCARMAATTQGGYGTIVTTGWTGTSVVTVDSANTHPNDEYEAMLKIVTGGTIGTAGITLQYSLDGGRTMSPVTALGTANTFAIPNSGSTTFKFAAGTAVAGDVVTCPTTAPAWGSSDLTTTLGALAVGTQSFDTIVLVGTASAADLATLDTWCASRFAAGKFYDFVCNNVGPTSSQTDAQWQTAQQAAFASSSTTFGECVAGYSLTRSSISARRYRRPDSWALAARYSKIYLGQDAAEIDLGPLPGVQLSDDNGNPKEHDEAIYPGMDAARFATLRTVTGYQGVYPTNPRMMAPAGSDFIYRQFRRVMNVACAVTLQTLTRRLSKAIRVNPKTGFIREEDARDIEVLVNSALRTALMSKPSVSSVQFVLSRTDNVLSTFSLTGDVRLVPLGYPKQLNVTMAFNNPAIRTA